MNSCSTNSKVYIGWAMKDITPAKPVALVGQSYERISKMVRDPITATALALETRDSDGKSEQCIMVSCDLLGVQTRLQENLRRKLAVKLPGFDSKKLFLSATHIHTGPFVYDDILSKFWGDDFNYNVKDPEVMHPEEYAEFLVDVLCEAVVEAWESRKEGGISREMGHAVIGHNRRVVYDDGSAQMYGSTDTVNFDTLEGPEDQGVEMLYFWDKENELTGLAINIVCTAQVLEHKEYITADYWGEVRNEAKRRFKKDVFVLGLIGAAGDQSPRDLVRRSRDEASIDKDPMHNESGLKIIADKILNTVQERLESAKDGIKSGIIIKHMVEELNLPIRQVSRAEAERAKNEYDAIKAKHSCSENSGGIDMMALSYLAGIKNRYIEQEKCTFYKMELHVIRIGDVAIATNPFEFFIDYGLRIKARSKAKQTFIIQLACDYAGYLPTPKAIAGGGYSSNISNGYVGPEGGHLLVNRTVEAIRELWSEKQD